MTGTIKPIGQELGGLARLGDGLTVNLYPRTNALGISYTISVSKYAVPLGITYTIQRAHTSPLLIYYQIRPQSQFAINGDGSILAPDNVVFGLRPVVARSLIANPLLQGYPTVTWTYTTILWSDWNHLISYYSPSATVVLLTYPDETGTWIQCNAVLHPPNYGVMSTFQISNASFTFSILPF